MKSKLCFSLQSLSVLLLIVFFSCSKSNAPKTEATNEPDNITTQTTGCTNPPNYGDSIIYTQNKGNKDFFVSPQNNTVAGTWFGYPEGLVIDPASGKINVTQSESGERYKVGFVKAGTKDTCISQIILGGITYVDSIYVLEKNDSLATPYFNANPAMPPVCDASDDTDYPGSNGNGSGNNNCKFDDPPSGKKANDAKIRVRSISGIINLKKTLNDGAFGTNPQNGAVRKATIYYRLNDKSAKALQKINVQLMYFNSVSDIPAAVKNDVQIKRKNFFEYRIVNEKPRPPLLIITRFSK